MYLLDRLLTDDMSHRQIIFSNYYSALCVETISCHGESDPWNEYRREMQHRCGDRFVWYAKLSLYSTAMHPTVRPCTTLHYTVLYCPVQQYTACKIFCALCSHANMAHLRTSCINHTCTVKYDAVQCRRKCTYMKCNTIMCNVNQCTTVQWCAVQCSASWYNYGQYMDPCVLLIAPGPQS